MFRPFPIVTAGVLLAAAAFTGFATTASAAPTAADATFVTSNEQVNLAEQSIGGIAMQRGTAASQSLAAQTVTDHKTAQAKLTTVAQGLGATLPTTPNAMQMAQAMQLKTTAASTVDLMYAQIQVAGHEQAIAAAQAEVASTQNAALRSYAQYYVGIATMHLQMAQAEVQALGGTPTAVPAGTGGQAAARAASASASASDDAALLLGGGVLVVVGGAVALRRSRRTVAG